MTRARAGRVRGARGRRRPRPVPGRRLRRRGRRPRGGRGGAGEVRRGEAVAQRPADHCRLRRRLHPAEQQCGGQVPQGHLPVAVAGQDASRHG